MRKLPPLGALRVFEAAARRLSFKLAAEELNVTPTAVSHQVRMLEKILGAKLFERRTRHVRLTASGHALFPTLREGLDGFEHAIDAIRRSPVPKVAILSSTIAFVAKRLAPRAGSFRTAHPDWTLRLDASNEPVDLEADADAAVRYGSGNYPGLLVEPLFQDRFSPVCIPKLARAVKENLKSATLVHFDWGPARSDERASVWRTWLEQSRIKGIAADAGLSFTDEMSAVQATIAGQGVGLLSLTLVAEELDSGVLVQPFSLSMESFRYDLVYSARAIDRPATTLLRNWVMSEFRN
ncbi:MAG: LysR substrate-binding domain-containing protein [Burkholderiales bacterium]